jgi:hypothetical protein
MKLRDHAKSLGLEVGCSDGMGTNGGCRCTDRASDRYDLRVQVRALTRVAQHLAAEVAAMRPVVEVAIAYCEWRTCGNTLTGVVDAYKKAARHG